MARRLTTLGLGLVALRRQTRPCGEKINTVPAHIVVPPELEILARQRVTQVSAAQTSNLNPLAGKLEALVDLNLPSAIHRYPVARPGSPAGLRHANLDGCIGPQVDQNWDFATDGLSIRVRKPFGAAFAEWRAWYYTKGLWS